MNRPPSAATRIRQRRPAAAPESTSPEARRLQWLTEALLIVGLLGLQPSLLLSWVAIGLTVLAGLKLLEAKRLAERRLVGLLQLVCAGVLGALQADLGASLLQGVAVFLALAGLLALEAGQGPDWRLLLRRSLQVLVGALPVALALFVLMPRLAPFAPLNDLGKGGARMGLSESLAPGSIASLAANREPAARVSFEGDQPPETPARYWRVLVHDRFDGESWQSSPTRPQAGPETTPAPAGTGSSRAQQLWVAEASGLEAVPWDGSALPLGGELRINGRGELLHSGRASQRRLYGLRPDQGTDRGWRRIPPRPRDLSVPAGTNPQLEALGRSWQEEGPPAARLALAETWFRSRPFRYNRSPGTLPARAPLDAFLFERQEGFCGHYASAFSALMRAAGVPARVVSGYQGGTWVQPLGGPGYLDLRQDNAHAWSEVWVEAEGWRRVDPSTWIAPARGGGLRAAPTGGAVGWLERQWWALDLAWGRWWLGFDREGQEALLQSLLGERRNLVGVLVLAAVTGGLGISVSVLGWLRKRPEGDPPRRELERALAALARRGVVPEAGETLRGFSARLEQNEPELGALLRAVAEPYELWRYGTGARPPREARRLSASLRGHRRGLEKALRRQPQRRPTA
jgi:transglutaminase-like putative cysteine protease